jgi:anaerobic magnesium-protoporphyrin IX monomethyl ester cyclase
MCGILRGDRVKVLVLNPSSRVTRNVVRDVLYGCWCKGKRIGGGTVPPFALLSVATVLKQAGNIVDFVDAAAEQRTFEEVQSTVDRYQIVVITTSSMSFVEDASFLAGLKAANPALTTIVFGSHPTFMPQYTLQREGVDIIALHEPEYIVRDVVATLEEDNSAWRSVKGIGYRHDGQVVLNEPYPFIKNLDELPFLDTSLMPPDIDYFNPIVKRLPYITTTTSRGCPGQCTFCPAANFYGSKIRFRSAESTVDEMAYYVGKGFREVYFRDETFTASRKRTVAICEGILRRGLDVTWICNARVGTVDRETMALMKRAGCHLIKVGVESGVQDILDRARKGITVEGTRQFFAWAHEVGMDTHAHLMLGMPSDNAETIQRTIDFVLEVDPTTATFGICTPYPGTALFSEVVAAAPEIADGTATDLSRLHTIGLFNELFTDLSRQELEATVQRAYRAFYLRLSYFARYLGRIKTLDDLKRVSIAATNVLDFSLRGE